MVGLANRREAERMGFYLHREVPQTLQRGTAHGAVSWCHELQWSATNADAVLVHVQLQGLDVFIVALGSRTRLSGGAQVQNR